MTFDKDMRAYDTDSRIRREAAEVHIADLEIGAHFVRHTISKTGDGGFPFHVPEIAPQGESRFQVMTVAVQMDVT